MADSHRHPEEDHLRKKNYCCLTTNWSCWTRCYLMKSSNCSIHYCCYRTNSNRSTNCYSTMMNHYYPMSWNYCFQDLLQTNWSYYYCLTMIHPG